ncbi:MAG: DUF4404 family protein [Gemmataceae bacterium]|nr:DUF4404 family protein [Gemmataceae bacterium]MDW8265998.1 DUF4404 family protein [Gemmataceae bacterium]
MAATPQPDSPAATQELRTRLREVAELMSRSASLDAESQKALRELLDELTQALDAAHVPAEELHHLAESTAHLAEALHQQQDRGVLGKARQRLEWAVANAEQHAPLAVGLARRLLDALANIGI